MSIANILSHWTKACDEVNGWTQHCVKLSFLEKNIGATSYKVKNESTNPTFPYVGDAVLHVIWVTAFPLVHCCTNTAKSNLFNSSLFLLSLAQGARSATCRLRGGVAGPAPGPAGAPGSARRTTSASATAPAGRPAHHQVHHVVKCLVVFWELFVGVVSQHIHVQVEFLKKQF